MGSGVTRLGPGLTWRHRRRDLALRALCHRRSPQPLPPRIRCQRRTGPGIGGAAAKAAVWDIMRLGGSGRSRSGCLDPVTLWVALGAVGAVPAKGAPSGRELILGRKRLISASSSLLGPGRDPESTSDWIAQRRTDSLPTPSCLATTAAAAVREDYSPRWSLTSRTALALTSSSIFFGMLLILLDSNRSGIKPGALHTSGCRNAVLRDAALPAPATKGTSPLTWVVRCSGTRAGWLLSIVPACIRQPVRTRPPGLAPQP
jgi:hypothetical protein